MRVLDLVAPRQFAWREVAEPDPRPGEELFRVRFAGICGTDLHAYSGRQPFISYPRRLGHELSVEVVHGPPGVYCAVNPYLHCSRCQPCRAGRTNCCENLEVLGVHVDGGFAPLMSLPPAHVYPSSHLSAEELALVEPLVVGRHAVGRAGIATGESVLVVGAGPIGLSVALFAKSQGADLVLCEARADRRQACRKIIGTAQVLAPGPEFTPRLRRIFGGDLPQVVFDVTGSQVAMHGSFELVAHGGRYVFVGHYPGDFTFYEPDFHRRELTLLASRNGTHEDFLAVVQALEEGAIDAAGLVTNRYTLSDLPQVLPAITHAAGCD